MILTDRPALVAHALWRAKVAARLSLGVVWIYEGLIPKILFFHAHSEQTDLVRRSGFYWITPEFTLIVLGVVQVIVGIILVIGWQERAAVVLATLAMCVLIVFVATGDPAMLTDPFGALVKDLCLGACALTVWLLAPLAPHRLPP
jgi:uncharacterized membrane protein YphA (DoxX/SURF4 family)